MTELAVLVDLAEWCHHEREKLGAIDGYDYTSGEEYGLRRAQLEIQRRAVLLRASGEEACAKEGK